MLRDQPSSATHAPLDGAKTAWVMQATGNRVEFAAPRHGLSRESLQLKRQRLGMLPAGEQPSAS